MKTPQFYTKAPPFSPPPSIQDTIRQLWDFVLRPHLVEREHKVLEKKLPLIFQITFLELLLQTFLLVLLALLYEVFEIEYLGTSLTRQFITDIPFLPLFVTVVLLGPVKEEIIFRLPLVYSRGFIVVALLVFLFSYGTLLGSTFSKAPILYLSGALAVATLAVWFLTSKHLQENLHQIWKRYYSVVFYLLTAFFALMHLVNYKDADLPLYLLLLLVLPKFVGGIFLGYTRLRLGMGWAVVQHMFNNVIALLLLYGYLTGS